MRVNSLVWTRARADWASDRPLLEAALPIDAHLLHLPSLAVTKLPFTAPAGDFDAAVLLSANAVRHALADAPMAAALRRAKTVYTHGATTAEKLKEQGFAVRHVGECRTAEELGPWLAKTLPAGAKCLWPTAADPAHDLAPVLSGRGIAVARVDLYKTETGAVESDGTALAPRRVEELLATLTGVVCFASPTAVKGFADVFRPATTPLGGTLTAVVLGPTTANAARSLFKKLAVADDATLPSLIDMAVRLLG